MRGRGRRGRGTGPRGRRGGGPSLPRERRPRTSEYDAMDLCEIKAMLEFYIDALAKYPRQSPELLRKVAVAEIKTADEIKTIIATAFTGKEIPAETAAELCNDLLEINEYANKSKLELRLKSHLKYNAEDVAKMVHDAAMEAVLEKQEPQAIHQVTLVELENDDELVEKHSKPDASLEISASNSPAQMPVEAARMLSVTAPVAASPVASPQPLQPYSGVIGAHTHAAPQASGSLITNGSYSEPESPSRHKKASIFTRLSHFFHGHKKEEDKHDDDNRQRYLT